MGIFLEKALRWSAQVNDMIGRVETRLGIMKGYSAKFARKTLLQIYTCYIRPILEYGDVVWVNLTAGDSEKLGGYQQESDTTCNRSKTMDKPCSSLP